MGLITGDNILSPGQGEGKFDKKTGEIAKVKQRTVFIVAKVAEKQKYDGYYAIVTSELDMSE